MFISSFLLNPLKNSFLNSSTKPAGALSISWKAFTFLDALIGCLEYELILAVALEDLPLILSPTSKAPLFVSSI